MTHVPETGGRKTSRLWRRFLQRVSYRPFTRGDRRDDRSDRLRRRSPRVCTIAWSYVHVRGSACECVRARVQCEWSLACHGYKAVQVAA